MDTENNLTPETEVTPTEVQGSLPESTVEDRLENFFNGTSEETPSDTGEEVVNEVQQAEEPSTEETIDIPVEASSEESQDSEEIIDETDTQDEPTNADDFIQVDYEELGDKLLPIKYKGEILWKTFDEIQNDAARGYSANTDVNQAKEKAQEAENLVTKTNQREELLRQREELLGNDSQLQLMTAQWNEAKQAGDTDKANEIARNYQSLETQVKEGRQKFLANHLHTQANKLKESGYGHLISNEQSAKKMREFFTNATPEATKAAEFNAEVLMWAEDARKWRESQAKVKKGGVLKGSGRTLKAQKTPTPSPKVEADAKRRQRFKTGKETYADKQAALNSLDDWLNS